MNICYVGKRNIGKTTLLKKFFLAVIRGGNKPIIVLDSAVEEGSKSLINQLCAEGYTGHYFIFKNYSDIDTLKKFFKRVGRWTAFLFRFFLLFGKRKREGGVNKR